jgi:hypothetical protein
MLRLSSRASNPEILNGTAASHQVHLLVLTTVLRVRAMSCDIELQGNQSQLQAEMNSMALERAGV